MLKGAKTTVLRPDDARFGAHPMKFANDMDLAGDVIYFVDSSFERDVNEAIEEHFEAQPRGRLYSFDLKTNELTLLLEGLYFPNGLELSPNKDYVLINENTAAKIIKFVKSGLFLEYYLILISIDQFEDTI
jgi:sugar lactone lactonase YvrE